MLRILLIDDEDAVRRVIQRMLETLGHRVDEAESGRGGLLALHEASYDLVITDIVMPGMEGTEVVSIVKRQWPQVPVIAMSGGGHIGDPDNLRTARELGAAATLQKPFRMQGLRAAIDQARGKADCGESDGDETGCGWDCTATC
ncbi:MAG TPA: response regulator [Alphaproteobacteria bacterium]|nr:response regulator [Alphaproteobacteria bacterium]